MTQEEAIENIKLIRFNAAITNANSFKEALDMAIKALSQPSLSSDIDKAAEKYSNIPGNFGDFFEIEYEFGEPIETIVDDKVFVKDAFKAGAEWMAGQRANT